MKTVQGTLQGSDLSIAIVTTRWNDTIVNRLKEGAVSALSRTGVQADAITEFVVPGAFELPMIVKRAASSGKYDAVIALGVVIRGATTHYDYVCSAATSGIASAGLETGIPCLFGVLTTETIEQALERSGTKAGNKGEEVALAAVEMATLLQQM